MAPLVVRGSVASTHLIQGDPVTSEESPRAMATANVAAIAEFLDSARIPYELGEHDPAMGRAAEVFGPNTGIAPIAADLTRE